MKINKVFLSLLVVITINIGSMPITHAEIPSVKVMSRNIYLGADVGRALELIPNLPAAAQYMWDQVRQTDFSKRAKILSAEINQSSPDVIGLQEATIWYCQKYPWSKKIEVFNFTQQLLDALGGRYQLVSKDGVLALNPGFSINPIPFLTKVNDAQTFKAIFGSSSASCGFETGDALLVKKSDNLEIIEVGNSEYEAAYSIVPTIMTIYRGYSWADIKVNGVPTRFVTTHLESLWDKNKVPNSAKQAMQLVRDLSSTNMPIIVMGDFNADPRDPRSKDQSNPGEQPVESNTCQVNISICNAYLIMSESGYKDAGPDSLDPKNFTWGMNALLTGADPKRLAAAELMGNKYGFTDRLDYIFSKNGTESIAAEIIGTQGEYGSDHAGVVATIALLNQSNNISEKLPAHAPFPLSFWQVVIVMFILLIAILSWRRKKKQFKISN